MGSTPAFSHMEKITTIAQGLVNLGYPVSFITGPSFKDYVESIGATYIPIEGAGLDMMSDEDLATFISLPTGPEMEAWSFKTIFIKTIPAQHRTLQRAFSDFRAKYGEEQKLIYIFDCVMAGISPVMLGAPGIRPDAAIAIGLAPYMASSNDTFPFRSGRLPDTSPLSRQIHFEAQRLHNKEDPVEAPVNEALHAVLDDMGTTKFKPGLFDMITQSSDIYLQYGIPAFEYSRSDIRSNFEFIGAPVAVGIADRKLPEWWDDVLQARKEGKHIIAVSSSSVVFDTNALIKPALEAFKDRSDVFVIATLVTSDVETLDFQIPGNARIAKFIPLDLALPYVSVLISNGGYGTVQQSLSAGVPMILSGVGQDKLHTGTLVNYTGYGIYHAVSQASPQMLTDSFDEIMGNGTYSVNMKAVKKKYEEYNAVAIVDATVQKIVRGELTF
ncbi:UDP-Glycosyltransferase/glycogen phosphorylase [Clathrospora elynae]|uniref:UDP-Glycosyltransferase/glycogen phosphorylase n=1 Tax=Clathrospora elynae TaxID=706981 RepID=A0A6A5SMH8_9PLEO|nr:UDP-Glycosyltransferase/glycogen phosphorylase [Clathrospora elynae]